MQIFFCKIVLLIFMKASTLHDQNPLTETLFQLNPKRTKPELGQPPFHFEQGFRKRSVSFAAVC